MLAAIARATVAGGAGYSADWWMPTAFSALLREELESLLDELLVVLEDSAVAGVRVDHPTHCSADGGPCRGCSASAGSQELQAELRSAVQRGIELHDPLTSERVSTPE